MYPVGGPSLPASPSCSFTVNLGVPCPVPYPLRSVLPRPYELPEFPRGNAWFGSVRSGGCMWRRLRIICSRRPGMFVQSFLSPTALRSLRVSAILPYPAPLRGFSSPDTLPLQTDRCSVESVALFPWFRPKSRPLPFSVLHLASAPTADVVPVRSRPHPT